MSGGRPGSGRADRGPPGPGRAGRRWRRWLPHPILSALLLGTWLLLANSLAPGHLVLGGLFGLAIPVFTAAFWPDRPRIRRPGALLRLIPVVLRDIVVANFVVARMILDPTFRVRPAFVVVPLELRDPYAITTLANIITLTPGTVSAWLDPERRRLLVHGLDVEDPARVVARIKGRYERPLKEIFEC